MQKLKNIFRKSMDIVFDVLYLYMLFILFEISIAVMLDEPKIFIPTLIICAVLIFIDRFKKRK